MAPRPSSSVVPVEQVGVATYTVPTDAPESDGTIAWTKTTMVVVEVRAGGLVGIGWSYADRATATVVRDALAEVVTGKDALAVADSWWAMRRAVRNLGARGIAAMALSAVDAALWDVKAKLLGLPLARLLGQVRPQVAIYGSGGFTSYDVKALEGQLAGWAAEGIERVKMKIGRSPSEDLARVRAARRALDSVTGAGRPGVELFVDANGAYARKQALAFAERFVELGVTWFEEPVSSDDLDGLRLLVERAPAGMDVTAGEYGYDPGYFRRMLAAGAVDVLQADATRCLGPTGFLGVAALCDAFQVPLSAHCAPTLHAPLGCAAMAVRHLEYFHDHARIERLLLDGAPAPVRAEGGALRPDPDRPGFGVDLKRKDAERFAS